MNVWITQFRLSVGVLIPNVWLALSGDNNVVDEFLGTLNNLIENPWFCMLLFSFDVKLNMIEHFDCVSFQRNVCPIEFDKNMMRTPQKKRRCFHSMSNETCMSFNCALTCKRMAQILIFPLWMKVKNVINSSALLLIVPMYETSTTFSAPCNRSVECLSKWILHYHIVTVIHAKIIWIINSLVLFFSFISHYCEIACLTVIKFVAMGNNCGAAQFSLPPQLDKR